MPVCSHVPKWLHEVCDYKFLKDHVACDACAKKKCSTSMQYRDVDVSTMLVYDHGSWLRIKSEVVGRQGIYQERVIYETLTANICQYYEAQHGKKKGRARGPYWGRFRYAVRKGGERFVIYHFDGIVQPNPDG